MSVLRPTKDMELVVAASLFYRLLAWNTIMLKLFPKREMEDVDWILLFSCSDWAVLLVIRQSGGRCIV